MITLLITDIRRVDDGLLSVSGPFCVCVCVWASSHLSGGTGVMSMRGGSPKGNEVGRLTRSSSGLRVLSICRHDNGGKVGVPEWRR